jgi:pyruvate dehydrogenase E2 component (dihydrolipoamide acetyltransferase)
MTELVAVTTPKWGLAMEEGTVTSWLVREGAAVTKGEDIVEIESSKIANVVEAPATGTLLRIVTGEGDVRPIGSLLAVIGPEATPADEIDAFVGGFVVAAPEAEEAAAAAAPRSAEVGGRTLSYIEAGDHAGDALPLLLVHGFSGDKNNWLFNIADLASERRVVALDLPGHGASSKDVGDGSIAVLADSVAGFMDAIGMTRAVVVGHSMGGGVAIELAAAHPQSVAGVVLLSALGTGNPVNRAFIDELLAADRRKEMKAALRHLFADEELVSRDMVEALLAYRRLDGVQAALDALALNALSDASGAALDAKRRTLTMPVMVLHGEKDAVIAAPGHGETLPTGHMPQMEAAADVNRRIREFVASLEQ